MYIKPQKNILLIKKHKNSKLKADIAVDESDNDKSLITGEVLQSGSERFKKGDTVIFGKYSLFGLLLQGDNYYFLDADDVLAICDYKEK